jgi:hypothetical protein
MKTLIVIILSIASITAFSQNCNDFLNNSRMGVKYPWKFDNQSKTGLFLAGKTSVINVVCQEGKDYRIAFSISTNITKNVTISITDENGKEYFAYGASASANKELTQKKELMISLENQKLTIKGSKAKLKLEGDVDNLKLEIEKMEREIDYASSSPKTYYEFTPANTMNLTITITLGETSYKGCVTTVITNKNNSYY